MGELLPNVKAIKTCRAGDRVSFRARALRFWETGGLRLCPAGDEGGRTRVEVGEAGVEQGRSYEFRDALVQEHPGGWHSVSIAQGGQAIPLAQDVPISQDEAYIEFTFKILSGVQRKRGRKEGRLPPWQHPAQGDTGPPADRKAGGP